MKIGSKPLTLLAAIIAISAGTQVLAVGDKNAYKNPTGEPDDGEVLPPYSNKGDGRTLVFCGENETLVVTPVDEGAVELQCIPTDG